MLALNSQAIAVLSGNIKCPGVIKGDTEGRDPDGYCCVGGHLTISNCEGWPICKGPQTVTQTSIECSTKVPFSIDNYDSVVDSASSHYLTDGWDATGTSDGKTEETGQSSASDDAKGDTEAPKTENAETATETDSGATMLPVAPFDPAAIGALAVASLL